MNIEDTQDKINISGPVRIAMDALKEGMQKETGLVFTDNQALLFALMYVPIRFDGYSHNEAYMKALRICLVDPCELEESYLKGK
jgi:hypothetical protein